MFRPAGYRQSRVQMLLLFFPYLFEAWRRMPFEDALEIAEMKSVHFYEMICSIEDREFANGKRFLMRDALKIR